MLFFALLLVLIYFSSAQEAGIAYKSMERSLQKIRHKVLPKCPTNVAEIIDAFNNDFVRNNYGLTSRGKESERSMFYKHAYECDDYSYCCFSSDDVTNAVQHNVDVSRRVYIFDATFKVCPLGPFMQLLIVSINMYGQVSSIRTNNTLCDT